MAMNDDYSIGIDTSSGIKSLQQLQTKLRDLQKDFDSLKVGDIGTSGLNTAVAGLKGLAAVAVAATAGIAAFGTQFKKALDIKAEQESAQLGIKALLASMYEFRDKSGKILTGNDKLKAAGQEAQKQLEAIRLAGLKTAATGQEIQESFKVALGVGATAGLDPDKINKITLGLIQAGKAFSIKGSDALSSEIKAVFSGEQTDNSSIVKAMQLTGTQIKQLAEQGKLYDVLTEKLKVYGDLADETSQSFDVLSSNVGEAYDLVLSKAIDQGAFDSLKKSLAEIPQAIISDSGDIKTEFQGIVDFIGTSFNAVSEVLGTIISGIMTVAKDFSAFLSENKAGIDEFANSYMLVWESVKAAIGIVYQLIAGVVGAVLGATTQSGALANGFIAVARVIAIVNDAVGTVFGSVTALVGLVTNKLFGAFSAVAKGFDKIFGTNTAKAVDAIAASAKRLQDSGAKMATNGLAGTAQAELRMIESQIEAQSKLNNLKSSDKKLTETTSTVEVKKVASTDKTKKAKDQTAEINKLNDAQLKLDNARDKASFESFKDALDLKKEELKKLLAFNEISKKESLDREFALDASLLEKEKSLAAQKVDNIKKAIAQTPSKDKAKLLNLEAELTDAQQELDAFTSKERKLTINLEINKNDIETKTADMLSSLQREIAGLQGNTLTQSISEINANLSKALKDELVTGNTELQAALTEKAALQIQAAYASEAQRQSGLANSFLSVRQATVESQYDRGLISYAEKEKEIAELRGEALTKLEEQYQVLLKMSELDPNNMDLKLQTEQAGLAIDELKGKLEEGGGLKGVFESIKSPFKSFVNDLMDGTKSIGDSFKNMLSSIASALADKALNAGLAGLFSGAGAGGGGAGFLSSLAGMFGGLPGFANGGYITGPGTGTSDSILARIANGEYIIKASTVAAMGRGFFDHVNQFASVPRFASGGLAGSVSAGPTNVTASFNPSITMYKDQIEEAIYGGNSFEKQVIRIVNSNRSKIRN